MKSLTNLRSQFSQYTGQTASAVLTQADVWLNDGVRFALGTHDWPFLEKTATKASVASQQAYQLPYDYGKLISVITTIGSTQYVPMEAPNRNFWNVLNMNTSITSDIPVYYYLFGKTISFYPAPASTAGTYTFTYKKTVVDLSIADYTTGTVVSVANGGTAVVGSGTTWAVSMAGRFMQITASNTANKGDGAWYEIASSASTTSLTLTAPYGGTAISAGSAAYTIGQVSVLPENYQQLPVWYAVAEYWASQREMAREAQYRQKFDLGCAQMLAEYGEKSESPVIDYGQRRRITNPNLYPNNLG